MLGLRMRVLWVVMILVLILAGCGRRRARAPQPAPNYAYAPYAPNAPYPAYAPGPPAPSYPPQPSYASYPPPGAVRPPAPVAPVLVRVSLLGVVAGPRKADKTQWDGFGQVSDSDFRAIGKALGLASPHAAAAAVVAVLANGAWAKPEVEGTAELVTGTGASTPFALTVQQDSFTPQWAGVTWSHVPLDGTARIRVALRDRDLKNHDPMGMFEIGAAELQAALTDGHVYPARVHVQTTDQVLFAKISVIRE